MQECRAFLMKLMKKTYPEKEWDEEQFKKGFYAIDYNNSGMIDFSELFDRIYLNAKRQGMVTGAKPNEKK